MSAVWEQFLSDAAVEIVAAVVAALIGGLFAGRFFGFRVLRDSLRHVEESLAQCKAHAGTLERDNATLKHESATLQDLYRHSEERLKRFREALQNGFDRDLDGQTPWSEKPSRIPIIAIGNLKGGVGKTTLAANLGAYLGDQTEGGRKPTLFIDLDFQGSLSATLVSAGVDQSAGPVRSAENRVAELFAETDDPARRLSMSREVQRAGLQGSRFYDATAELAQVEEVAFFDWVFETDALDKADKRDLVDPRLRLAQFLASAEVQDRFGAVVIDLPPRTTLFAYAALCAANNVVIPTRDDLLSRDAARTFTQFLEAGRESFWPRLNIVGLAGVNTRQHPSHGADDDLSLSGTARDLNEIWNGPQPMIDYLGRIPWMLQIHEVAADDFAYFRAGGARALGSPKTVITLVCQAIEERLRL